MTTKTDERKALEQIRKIVEGLGKDSYVATAFDGCFEIAEQNIDNDWACSMKERADDAEKTLAARNEKCKELTGIIGSKDAVISGLTSELDELRADYKKEVDDCMEYCHRAVSAEENLKEANNEIIKLKAKLYDMMTKD